jgi:shikimate dehydrogenase
MNKSPDTKLAGLIGRGIGGSRSPHIHEAEAAAIGLPLVYRIVDFDALNYPNDKLGEVLQLLQEIGFDGVNITHPFKQQVMSCVDTASKEAIAIGAVNTIVFREGARAGFNTDWSGFRASMLDNLRNAKLDRVALIGAGGAGAAVAYALLRMGVRRLTLTDQDQTRAAELAGRFAGLFREQVVLAVNRADVALQDADGVVNASPVGMLSHPGLPFDTRLLRSELWVVDIVYFPIETGLMKAARKTGCRALSGAGMVVQQAADAFRLITSKEPSVDRMLRSFEVLRQPF